MSGGTGAVGGESPAVTGETAAVGTRVGTWRAWARGWRVIVPTVVLLAVLQALLVLGDPQPGADLTVVLLTALSFVLVVIAVGLVAEAALAAVDGRRLRVPDAVLLGWSALLLAVIVAVAVLFVWATPVAVAAAAFVLPAAADGTVNALRGFTVFARHPARALTGTVVMIVVLAVSWVLAVMLGLFVTGPLAALGTWLWFGLVGSLILCARTVLYRRSRPAPDHP